VVGEAEKAPEALEANSRSMKQVMAALGEQGVAEVDIRTSGFNLQPKYVYPNQDGKRAKKPRIVGYTVRNTVTVQVRDLDKVGTILQKSVELGVNSGGNIQFGNADPGKAIDKARTLAMKDATARAKTLARAAGVGLGDILSISENYSQPRPQRARMEMMSAAADTAVPVAAGENSYRVSVKAYFAIDQ
jgi:uncharacterized protein YggE